MARTPKGRTQAGQSYDMTQLLSSLNKWSDERLKEIQAERKLLAEDYKKNRISKKEFDAEDKKLRKEETIARRENTKATNRATKAWGDMTDDMTKFANTIKDSTEEFSKYGAGFEYLSNKNNDLTDEVVSLLGDADKFAKSGDQESFDIAKAVVDGITKGTLTDEVRMKAEKSGIGVDEIEAFDKKTRANEIVKGKVDDVVNKFTSFAGGVDGFLQKIPLVGGVLSKTMGVHLENVKNQLRKNLIKQLKNGNISVKGIGRAFKGTIPAIRAMGSALMTATGGLTLLLGLLAAAAVALVGLAKKARDYAKDQGIAFTQSVKLQGSIMAAKAKMIGLDQDAGKIAGELITAFGTLDSVNSRNIAQVGKLSTRFGVATNDLITFQKSFTDVTGASVDVANDVVRTIGTMATGAGVAAGKVIADISKNMDSFARFSQEGASGMAKAAIEAAKIGSSLDVVVKTAGDLLNFEQSITAEFEAQVLTGRALNLENARRAALQGDFATLTAEIQKQVGGLGNLQSMNVVQKDAIAAALGMSVSDLMKIARGEEIDGKESQEELQKKTNEILIAGFAGNKEELQKMNTKKAGEAGMYQEFL